MGRRLDKDGGDWLTTVLPSSKENHIERQAKFTLLPGGALQGNVTVTFTGQEAMSKRLAENLEDDADRKRYLENDLKSAMPQNAGSATDQSSRLGQLSIIAASAVHRANRWVGYRRRLAAVIARATIYCAPKEHVFAFGPRTPDLFPVPVEESDDISIEVPKDWKVSSLPQNHQVSQQGFGYRASFEQSSGTLHVQRSFRLDLTLVQVKYYAELQRFYEDVRSADDEATVLERQPSSAAR